MKKPARFYVKNIFDSLLKRDVRHLQDFDTEFFWRKKVYFFTKISHFCNVCDEIWSLSGIRTFGLFSVRKTAHKAGLVEHTLVLSAANYTENSCTSPKRRQTVSRFIHKKGSHVTYLTFS